MLVALGVSAVGGLATAQVGPGPGSPDNEVFFYNPPSNRWAFDLQLFEPSTSPRSVLSTDLGTISSHLSFNVGLWTNFAYRPFVVGTPTAMGNVLDPVVGHLWQTELHGSLGLFEWLELGLAMPVVQNSWADFDENDPTSRPGALQGGFSPGDLRAYLKVPILRGSWPLAVRLGMSAPLGRLVGHYAGSSGLTLTPTVMLSHAFGPVTLAFNLSYRLRARNGIAGSPAFVQDDELLGNLAMTAQLHRYFSLDAELYGRLGVSEGGPLANRDPAELVVAGRITPSEAVTVFVGAGRGLTPGVGSPVVRAFAGVRISAVRSQCANGPEDYDGFQDGDFCADPDNDNDGIPDVSDRCPNNAEDHDGFLDADGCPDPDNDGDGILDDADRCPNDPEDRDGFQDQDGCPDRDNDSDGIPDTRDSCENEPEDLDNYQDDDGCPEPGPEPVTVTRTESRLLLSQRIFFDYNNDAIRPVSLPILTEVARTLRANPDITLLRVEGHTDEQGNAQYNLDLSYRRARAVVEYLVSQGVERSRLDYQGYGSQRPVGQDSSEDSYALNRRVEFIIVNQHATQQPAAGNNPPGNSQPNPPDAGGRRRRRRRGAH